MTVLHDAMTAYLSGLTAKKNKKEIWWQDKNGYKITVELVDADLETYIVREYYDNGKLWFEMNYCKDQLHGLLKCYNDNGNLAWEYNYLKSQRHGLCKHYYDNGNLRTQYNYNNGKRTQI